ncbi:MAG TPA: hypothetical protein VE130_10025 [Nitrososphaeraceae archaeon]|nr:hypothetical protein [Nitrososphaeraceae archaeon]
MEQNEGRRINDKVVGPTRRATKKGIIITAMLVAAIIGASFIVYFIP